MTLKSIVLNLGLVAVTIVSTHFITISSAQQSGAAVQPSADTEYQAGGTLYMQKAAEYRALAYQAYNIARWQLDADLEKRNIRRLPRSERRKPPAVMVDIDETVLDNSPAQAYNIKNHIAFNLKDWYAWGDMRKAKAIPGAVEFLNYAVSRGVKIFYASNRDEVQKQATIDNLRNVGLKDVTDSDVMLRTNDSSKEPRREIILQKYRILLFVGDNLDDHSNVFERRSIADRFAEVDKAKALFGKRYIMLPNAMYGTWESAIYEYGRLTDAQKTEKRANALELP
jgi:5'-nucleotidase (lipoprotein e(P4) family)